MKKQSEMDLYVRQQFASFFKMPQGVVVLLYMFPQTKRATS